jgi:hypothetical protein
MKLFTRGAAGLAATVATAVVVSMVPSADAAPAPSRSTTSAHQAATTTAPQSASSGVRAGSLTSKVRGTFNHGNGTVNGTFSPDRFIVKNGAAYAVGKLHATLHRADGSVRGHTTKFVSIPIKKGSTQSARSAKANCQVLDLVLGPLDLNLLGLKVHLDKVVLNIVAASGAGALLGNLICAVAGLLDGTGLLNLLKLINKLNQILNVLRA